MIAQHHRANGERTDKEIGTLGSLVGALDIVIEAHPDLSDNRQETEAVRVILRAIEDAVQKLEHAHRMEWVGVGGESGFLTDAEIAEAKGETAEVAA